MCPSSAARNGIQIVLFLLLLWNSIEHAARGGMIAKFAIN